LTETSPSRDRLIARLSKPDSTSILLSSMLCAQQWVRERVSIKQTLCNPLQGQDFEQTISCVGHSVHSTLRKFKGIIQHWYVGLHWLSCFTCVSRSPTKSADQTLGSKLTAFHSRSSSYIFTVFRYTVPLNKRNRTPSFRLFYLGFGKGNLYLVRDFD